MAFGAPPVDGLGSTGGFKLQVQDRGDAGLEALQGAVENVIEPATAQPGLVGLFTSFRATQPQLYVDVDRTKAKALGVSLDDVFNTLQVYLGSAYVNDFTRFGRNWQVNVQADAGVPHPAGGHRQTQGPQPRRRDGAAGDAARRARHDRPGDRQPLQHVPVGRGQRQHGAGVSSGQAIGLMEEIARQELPTAMSFEWTELTLQQILAGNTAVFVFALGALFVFLVLAAQYESWSLPLRHHPDRAHVPAGRDRRRVARRDRTTTSSRRSASWC